MVSITGKRRFKSERGAELIEFALVFPLLLLVILGIVDFGFLFQRMEVVTNAAREGARIAVLPGYLNADAEARVHDYIEAGGLPTAGASWTRRCYRRHGYCRPAVRCLPSGCR